MRLAQPVVHSSLTVIGLAALVSAAPISVKSPRSQERDLSPPHFQYDVVSIKQHRNSSSTTGVRSSFSRPDYGISAESITVASLVQFAYQTDESRISGLPAWVKSETYDVEARVDRSTIESLEKLAPRDRLADERQMLQALLSDRLKLAIHRESKEMPIYELTVAKDGPKLQPGEHSEGVEFAIGSTSYADGNRTISSKSAKIDSLAEVLAGQLHRVVLNKTSLAGRYAFTLVYFEDPNRVAPPDGTDDERRDPATPPSASLPGASSRALFDAIQEQLGLKLISAKGPVEIIVIDHIEHPTPN